VTDLPAALKFVIAAQLALSVLAAAIGRPPRRAHRREWDLVLLVGVVAAGEAALVLHHYHAWVAMKLALAGAVELLCLWTWLRRGVRPDDDGGEGRGEGSPAPPPAWDWDDFDRARRGWGRPRTGASDRS
jgi:hypothetical protein